MGGSVLSRTTTEEGALAELDTLSKAVPYSKQERLPAWSAKDIRWGMAIYIPITQLLGFAGIFFLPYCRVATLANSIANQGTIYHWARDHRTHHFHSETVAD